jgi:hypothetical protein
VTPAIRCSVRDELMMVVPTSRASDPHDSRPIVLHPDCFQIWNQERWFFR